MSNGRIPVRIQFRTLRSFRTHCLLGKAALPRSSRPDSEAWLYTEARRPSHQLSNTRAWNSIDCTRGQARSQPSTLVSGLIESGLILWHAQKRAGAVFDGEGRSSEDYLLWIQINHLIMINKRIQMDGTETELRRPFEGARVSDCNKWNGLKLSEVTTLYSLNLTVSLNVRCHGC